MQQLFKRRLNQLFGARIDAGCRFVEDQDARIG
jgi:hypothetical protein